MMPPVASTPLLDEVPFSSSLSDDDLYWFVEGRNCRSYRLLGAFFETRQLEQEAWVRGVCFRIWAPHARQVMVVMSEGAGCLCFVRHAMHPVAALMDSGVWEVFVPHIHAGLGYQFEIQYRRNETPLLGNDPYAQCIDAGTRRSVVAAESMHVWHDGAWLGRRAMRGRVTVAWTVLDWSLACHPASAVAGQQNYRTLADELIAHARRTQCTHVALHFPWSGGSFFAVEPRLGTADDLRDMVDACHRAGVGVLMDWHFTECPAREADTSYFADCLLVKNVSASQISKPLLSFLLSSAYYWLEEFHLDGLRLPSWWGTQNPQDQVYQVLRDELENVLQRDFPGVRCLTRAPSAHASVDM